MKARLGQLIEEYMARRRVLKRRSEEFAERWLRLKRSMFASNPRLSLFTEEDRVKSRLEEGGR